MKESKDRDVPSRDSIIQLMILSATCSVQCFIEESRQDIHMGQTFQSHDLGQQLHKIKPFHTIGMKAPRDGKR